MGDWLVELWLALIGIGVYHGINPAMGWPLALSAGLMERKKRALLGALGPLAVGHFAAIFLIILPFRNGFDAGGADILAA